MNARTDSYHHLKCTRFQWALQHIGTNKLSCMSPWRCELAKHITILVAHWKWSFLSLSMVVYIVFKCFVYCPWQQHKRVLTSMMENWKLSGEWKHLVVWYWVEICSTNTMNLFKSTLCCLALYTLEFCEDVSQMIKMRHKTLLLLIMVVIIL